MLIACQHESGIPARSAALLSLPSDSRSDNARNSLHFEGLTPSIQKTSPFFYFPAYPPGKPFFGPLSRRLEAAPLPETIREAIERQCPAIQAGEGNWLIPWVNHASHAATC